MIESACLPAPPVPPDSPLTHFDAAGQAHMVDVGDKEITHRRAVASGRITMRAQTFERISTGSTKKGDVLGIAQTGTGKTAAFALPILNHLIERLPRNAR